MKQNHSPKRGSTVRKYPTAESPSVDQIGKVAEPAGAYVRAPSFDELLKYVSQLNLPEMDQFVFRVIALRAQRRAPNLSKTETELLMRINQGPPPDIQQRFRELNSKRKAEKITPEEHQELLALIDRIEQFDVERVKYLAELANLRGTSLKALMKELDIHPPAYE
jgi:hypothetical protein